MNTGNDEPVEILLVEDNPGDVRLTMEALKESDVRNNLSVVGDGVEAMGFVRQEGKYADAPRPDLVLLDLNLPKKDGHEVLAEIKQDPDLKHISVVVLTSSKADEDILKIHNLHVACYVIKPANIDHFFTVVRSILAKYREDAME